MQRKVKKLLEFLGDKANNKRVLAFISRQTRPYIKRLLLLLVIDVVMVAVGLVSTLVGKRVVDEATTSGAFIEPFIWMVIISLFSIGVSGLTSVLSAYVNERFTFGVRSSVFSRVLRSRWQPLSAFHSGDLMMRMTSDVGSVAGGIAGVLPSVLMLLVRLVGAFFVLYHYDNGLALLALVLGPVGVALSLIFGEKLKYYQTKLKESESAYRAFMQESIENIVVLKTFGQEDSADKRMNALRNERLRLVVKQNRMSVMMNLCMRLVFSMGYTVAFGWGAYRLSQGSITYGTMTVFLSLVSQVQGPIMGLAQTIPQIINIFTSTKRVMDIDALPAEPQGAPAVLTGSVGFVMRGVTFGYQEETVLENVSIDIKPGDSVGIVGYSGSGKTTFIRLVLALITPQKADELYFYQADGQKEPLSISARRFIAYVPQGNSLSSGTIRENLLIGKPDAADDELWGALAVADAKDFVQKLPKGLDTPIAERAGGLSEGQAQRIAIARALLRDAALLILDEATSALDEQTEARVLRGIGQMGRGRTCLFITHRRSMLAYCNRALEISDRLVSEKTLHKEDIA